MFQSFKKLQRNDKYFVYPELIFCCSNSFCEKKLEIALELIEGLYQTRTFIELQRAVKERKMGRRKDCTRGSEQLHSVPLVLHWNSLYIIVYLQQQKYWCMLCRATRTLIIYTAGSAYWSNTQDFSILPLLQSHRPAVKDNLWLVIAKTS